MLMDQGVEGDLRIIDGEEQACMAVFGRIEKHADENEGITTSVKRATEEHTRDELSVKRQRFAERHTERASPFQADAVATPACLPNAESLNVEVQKNLLPSVPVMNAVGSGGPSLFMQDMDRDLARTEHAIIEAGQQWGKEAEKFNQRISTLGKRSNSTTLASEGASLEASGATKKAGNSTSASFVAELGAFRVAKLSMTAHHKTIDQEFKRKAKALKQTSAVVATAAWTPGANLGEALQRGLLPKS